MATLAAKPCVWAFVGLSLICCFIPGIFSDVPDGVVYTELHKTVQKGSRAVLTCEFYGTPLAVWWKKGDDPTSAPNLFRWVEGEPDSGSCVQDKTCEMGDDFSFIIKNISIGDQGLYICMISNYLGIETHNFTDVRVFALPKEPYPIINECMEKFGEHCTVSTSIPINVTCTVQRYFPTVDLFFLHNSRKYMTSETLLVTNTDGTKNKSIFTEALPSEMPYVCVASSIPGSPTQRTAKISVIYQDDVTSEPDTRFPSSTTPSGQHVPSKPNVIKIVVPIVVVFGLLVTVVLYLMHWRKRRDHRLNEGKQNGEDQQLITQTKTQIKGHLSFYEIWLLVLKSYTNRVNMGKLHDTFRELNITNMKPGSNRTQQESYQTLCDWKKGIQTDIQRETLRKALEKADYTEALKDDSGSGENRSPLVWRNLFEHILWHIGNTEQMNQFLRELIPNQAAPITGNVRDAVKSASSKMEEWIKDIHDVHSFILLSRALERADCNQVAGTFFIVPDNLKSPIPPGDVKRFTDKLTGRHCTRLATALQSTNDISDIISKNYSLLFDTLRMITEWLADQECSNYKNRCRLDDAALKIGRYGLQDFFTTVEHRRNTGSLQEHPHPSSYQSEMVVTDEEIESVAFHVKFAEKQQELTTKLQIKTGVNNTRSFADQLKDWRNTKDPTTCRDTLRKALGRIGLAECIVNRNTTKNIDQTELARVAFDLLMEDVRPIIEALEMKQNRVRKYMKSESKLEGTMGLVLELTKGKHLRQERSRNDFCKFALRDNGFINVSRSVYLDYVPSLSELFNIASSIDEDKMVCFLDHLDLDQDDLAECQDEKEQSNKMKLMRLWKHKIRPVPYHYRLELASALRESDLNELGNDVLSGRFRTGTPHPDVLHNILSRLCDDMIGRLCKLLKIGETGDRARLVALLVDWVIKWVNEFHSHEKDHRQKNDLLFNNGFGELAEEIAALEHCPPQSNTAP